MKREIRVLGIDDSPFDKERDDNILVVGVFFRGGQFMDGVLSTFVERDGDDATVKIIGMVNRSKFCEQLHAILLDGIAFGGFNVVNIDAVTKATGIPVITVTRRQPDLVAIKETLLKLGMEKKYKLMEIAGEPQIVELKKGRMYIQFSGCGYDKAVEIIRLTTTHGYVPEPLRYAHLIGQGIVDGESRGRA